MTDVRIVSYATMAAVNMDWLLQSTGTLDETEELATAVKVALGTDGLADADDQLPGLEDDTDRRGWWGDLDAAFIWGGWPIGSRLWLLRRASIVEAASPLGATLVRAEDYTREALQPFIDKRICSRITVNASRTGVNEIVVRVVIYRGPLPAIELQYQILWNEVGQ